MNKALIILESNELLRHIILFKLYVEGNGGAINNVYIREPIEELYGEKFNNETYRICCNYLAHKGYTNRNTNFLTNLGVEYFEEWLKSFENLSEDEKETLNNELPKPIFDFFKFSSNTTTVLSFINQVLKLSEKF